MRIKVTEESLEKTTAEALVVLHEEGGILGQTTNKALTQHFDAFARAVEKKKSRKEWFCTLEKGAGTAAKYLLLDSVTFDTKAPHDEPLKMAAARAVELCRAHSIKSIAFAAHHKLAAIKAAAMLEGALLGDFEDRRFKGKNNGKRDPLDITFCVPSGARKQTKALIDNTTAICEGVNHARELVNAPHHVLTPKAMAEYAQGIAKKHGMKCTVLNEKQIRKEGFELLWQVGRGSEYPPRMIVLEHAPKKRKIPGHICLAGKGMTFDTGGLCLKTRDSIFKMNYDMGGAAAVLGAMEAIARLKLPVRVTAIIAAAHNAVDGAAYTPGCIIKSKMGKSVFVQNTDAEGRLILADCFAKAEEIKPDILIDAATLTGHSVIALGPYMAGLFTEDEQLRTALMTASGNTGDGLWPLPLEREYESMLHHTLADLNNMGKTTYGGAIHAANFLKNFVPKGVRWAHLDIAGPANTEKRWRYYCPGATGYGVRLLVETMRILEGTE